MLRKTLLVVLFISFTRISFSQGIRDSVFQIQSVEISAERIFKKEEAGMKETRVDSIVLTEKISLSLSDILAENTTVYIKNYGRGALATASFRGTAPTHTQVSWNGMNINSPMLGMVDFSLIPVYIIDDMSLQHGAASVSQSSGGLGGHISLENKVDWNNKLSGRYIQNIGSFSTFDEFAQFSAGNKKIQSKTRVYHNYSKNNYEFVNRSQLNDYIYLTGNFPSQQNEDSDYRKYGAVQELYVKVTGRVLSSAKIWYQNAFRSIPMVTSYQGKDLMTTRRENRQDDATFKSVIDGTYYGDKITGKIRSGFDCQKLDYVMRNKVGGADWETPVNSGSDMRSWYNNLQIGYAFSDKINTELSVDGNYFQVTTLDSANQNGYDENRMESSVFTRLSAQVTKKINMQVSLRKDFIPNTSPPLTYVLGISFKPSAERNLVAKASVSRNFHNPALNDLYWQPGGNPELLPEEGFSYEAGVHYLYKGKKVNIENQTTFYYSDIDNWILWLPSVKGYWEAMNVKKVKSYGLEFNLQTTLQLNTIKFLLHSNYAFTKTLNYGEPLTSADESKGMQLPFIPVHSGNLLFSMYYRRFYGKFQYQYYGIRHLLSSNKAALEDDSGFFGVEASDNPFYRLYPHHIKHASAGKIFKWGKMEFETEFKVYNLFNEVYRSVLSRPMPKRNYSVLFKISF